MKKTLLSVLAFVLVITTVLVGIASLSVGAEQCVNMGACYQVDPDNPIIVDGKMDEAYRYGFHVTLDCRVAEYKGLYTYGIAYFAWSGKSIYCYVIVNDLDVAERATNADGSPSFWQADAVEMYVHRGDDISRDYPDTGNAALNTQNMPIVPPGSAHAGSSRARQYRIDGYDGQPSCYLFGPEDVTYSWNEEKGRLYGEKKDGSGEGSMITDDLNAFGWYPGGWANNVFDTTADEPKSPKEDGKGTPGFAVEYKIDFETELQAGEKIRFDLMVSDRYGDPAARQQANFYYMSSLRKDAGAVVSNINTLDHFTLTDEIAYNGTEPIPDAELYAFGRGDARFPKAEEEETKSLSKTERYSFTRTRTGTMPSATNSQQGATNTNKPTGTTTGNQGSSSGGCGGAIATTVSVVTLAMVGATGFYTFRRKKK